VKEFSRSKGEDFSNRLRYTITGKSCNFHTLEVNSLQLSVISATVVSNRQQLRITKRKETNQVADSILSNFLTYVKLYFSNVTTNSTRLFVAFPDFVSLLATGLL
jgi:hypothetical protein